MTHKKIRHSVGRSLAIYNQKVERGDPFTARDHFYYGNELRENGYYEDAIEQYDLNIGMEQGWIEDKVYACIYKSDCYCYLGDFKHEIAALFQSFQYSKLPRAESCSRIGYYFQREKDYPMAIYWYKLALQLKPDQDRWSFSYPAYYTWYPHLQLCVCYYHIEQFQKAFFHNEQAKRFRPEDPKILQNKYLLENKLNKITLLTEHQGMLRDV